MDERIERARLLYERAVFNGDTAAVETAGRELDSVEADLALARGRVLHARFLQDPERGEDPAELPLFERALELYQRVGDVRGEGETLFWIGVFHQVVRHDGAAAADPALQRSLDLATRVGDDLTRSYALRHLGIAEHMAGRLGPARRHLEESVRLRRELGFLPGVAANLIGLAYIAAAQGHKDQALTYLDEATDLAHSTGAKALTPTITEARTNLLPN